MKRKYCLIRLDGELGVDSFVYQVWAGSSLRESEYLALVENFCKDCGWYFKRWSMEVNQALENRSRLKRLDHTVCVRPYQMVSISIEKCYQTIIDDSWITLEREHLMNSQETFFRFRNVPAFIRRENRRNCVTTCPPSRRQYLSHRMWSEKAQAGLCLIGIVILMILDAVVSRYLV